MSHYHNLICTSCYAERVPPARAKLGYKLCISCGEMRARKVKHTVAPLNKSNYYYVSDTETLRQLNPKRTTV